jgi:serine/threonine protein kinase/Leucine-rich repeat (LRR) protein
MPAPVEPRPETGSTNAPSARSDVDETVAVGAASSSGAPAAHGFGPPAAPGEVGTLGHYRVVKELGRGGMGAVYAAIDTRLDRRLALKVMLPEFAADAVAKERFLREASAAAKISHDNVVTVFETDERQGVPYIAMQFLEGYPLDDYLKKKGTPTVPQVLRIAAEAAAGLAAAHKLGLVHRDIKPGNLWLEAPHGRVKVLDFGLAKPVNADCELTRSGAVVGTPAYMSPEQARGEKVDHRTDLFSLGAVLYRLCTGKLPFQGPTTMAVLMALGTEEPPPVRALNPAVPEPLAALIHQLLSKKAETRPQSAEEVVKRLRAISQELTAPRAHSAELSTSQPQVVQPQVVYVPIQVTALPPAENPFADLEATPTGAPADESAPPEPRPERAKPRGLSPWLLAGSVLALAALVVAGVIIIIKNKDGSETKIEVPDGSTVTVKDKSGKTLAQVGPGGKQPAADTSADRKAAEWVISQGWHVYINSDGRVYEDVAELPKTPFRLSRVDMDGAKVTDETLTRLKDCKGLAYLFLGKTAITDAGLVNFKDHKALKHLQLDEAVVGDAGLEHLKGCTELATLVLINTKVTDAGLKHLKDCTKLAQLVLNGTKVTDAGLAHLKEFKNLTGLSLDSTGVTDAGLERLKELKNLTYLSLGKTKVTAKGLENLHAALSGCKIDHDGGTIEAVDVDRAAAEWVLAQGGVVRIKGADRDIKAAAELPKNQLALTYVNLNGKEVSDAGLAQLRGLKNLGDLNLGGTPVSGAGLAHLKELDGLTHLNLGGTPVTGAGLAHLKELKNLWWLYLGATNVTDADLVHLKELKGLKSLSLWATPVSDAGLEPIKELKSLKDLELLRTKVTKTGAEALHEVLPACRIAYEGGVIEAIDVDRKAAEWVLAQGGSVRVNGGDKDVKAATELPKDRFTLTSADLTFRPVSDAGLAQLKALKGLAGLNLNNTPVSDAGLVQLKELKGLTALDLGVTKVSDAGLAHLKELKGLTYLHMQYTTVSDAGLAHLRELKSLANLNLGGTAVSDAGLANFKDCKGLTALNVLKTKVSPKGLAEFHAALPACRIDHDGGVIEPKK